MKAVGKQYTLPTHVLSIFPLPRFCRLVLSNPDQRFPLTHQGTLIW
jgi:hypothetical protein